MIIVLVIVFCMLLIWGGGYRIGYYHGYNAGGRSNERESTVIINEIHQTTGGWSNGPVQTQEDGYGSSAEVYGAFGTHATTYPNPYRIPKGTRRWE